MIKTIGTEIDGARGSWLGMTWSVTNASIRGGITRYFGSSATGRDNTPSAVRKSARTSSDPEMLTSSRNPANRVR